MVDIDIDHQPIVETRLLYLQVGIDLVEFLCKSRQVAAAFEVLPEKIGKMVQQVLNYLHTYGFL
jgi:myo-inositol-1-phosphate synthase